MIRRHPLIPAVLALVWLVAGRSPWVFADSVNSSTPGVASYTLTAENGLPVPDPNASAPQVVAEVIPNGGVVVPPTSSQNPTGNPLKILSDSHGFDPSGLEVGLKQGTDSNGQPDQLFGLAFNNSGLMATGLLHFSLSVDSALSTPPQLESLTPGVTIKADPITTSGTPGTITTPTSVNTPEPLSVLVWSVMGGLALVRARARRWSRLLAG